MIWLVAEVCTVFVVSAEGSVVWRTGTEENTGRQIVVSRFKELIYLSWNSRLNGKICPLLNTKKESRKKYILYGYSKRNCLCNREKEGRMEGKMAPQMAATVLCSSVFVLFCLFFLFFVSQTRSVLPGMNCLNIRQNTPQNLLPDLIIRTFCWTL